MKRFSYSIVFFLSIVFLGCRKKEVKGNKKLAQNYFKLAYVELSDPHVGIYHYKKALGYVEEALVQDRNAQYLGMKATLLFKLGQNTESLDFYEQALGCCNDACLKTEITNNYACLLAQLGDYDKASGLFKFLSIDRYYLTPEVALVNLGKMSVEKKDYKQAQCYFQQAVTMVPSYLDAHFFLAWSAYLNKDVVLAKQEVKTLLYLDPDCKMAHQLEQQWGIV